MNDTNENFCPPCQDIQVLVVKVTVLAVSFLFKKDL